MGDAEKPTLRRDAVRFRTGRLRRLCEYAYVFGEPMNRSLR